MVGTFSGPTRNPPPGRPSGAFPRTGGGQSTRGRPDDIIIRLIIEKHTRVMPGILPPAAPPTQAFP
ncbi:hypothetical protein GCM10009603_00130 [Nocardiopsis exhalans]